MIAFSAINVLAGKPKDLIKYDREPIETFDYYGNPCRLYAGGVVEVFLHEEKSQYYFKVENGFMPLPSAFTGPVISMGPPVHPSEFKPKPNRK